MVPASAQKIGLGLSRGLLCEKMRKCCTKLFDLWVDNDTTIGLVGVVEVIISVIGLGRVEVFQGLDCCHYPVAPSAGTVGDLFCLSSDFFLLRALVKYDAAVLGADVSSLAIERSWIVGLKKHFEQLGIGYDMCRRDF